MKIKVIPMAVISQSVLDENSCIEMENGTTVYDVILKLGLKKEHLNFITVMCEDTRLKFHEELKEGMELKIFLPVGGG